MKVKYRGDSARVHQLSLASLLPNTGDYVTYEVRHQEPGRVMISVITRGAPPTRAAGRQSPGSWWTSRCTSASRRWSCFTGSGRSAAPYLETQFQSWLLFSAQGDSPMMEKAPLGNNLRPRQPLNNRAVRTNIALSRQKVRQWGIQGLRHQL